MWGRLATPEPAASTPAAVDARARDLLDEMTAHEKLHLLSGDGTLLRGVRDMARRYNEAPFVAGELTRLGVPGIRYTDGPRGVVMGHATEMPVPMARAATFDPDLEERVGDAIGTECRALAKLVAGVRTVGDYGVGRARRARRAPHGGEVGRARAGPSGT